MFSEIDADEFIQIGIDSVEKGTVYEGIIC